jgi:hypothetical protein
MIIPMMDLLKGLDVSGLGTWVRQSNSLFAFPGILFCHTLGMALVAGISALICLRVLGVAATIPMESLKRLYPYMWGGLCLNVVSGVMLFVPGATVKAISPVFYTKLTFIGVAVVLMSMIRTRIIKKPDMGGKPATMNAKILAMTSMLCWLGAITAGRLLAYVGPGTESSF